MVHLTFNQEAFNSGCLTFIEAQIGHWAHRQKPGTFVGKFPVTFLHYVFESVY